ncbi:MAG: hypothetical protein N4A72_08825 [Bacteroidales bacterium]|jgi:hypothetical protein|nr:hypothetical protein [Bacteroidales bacterium]
MELTTIYIAVFVLAFVVFFVRVSKAYKKGKVSRDKLRREVEEYADMRAPFRSAADFKSQTVVNQNTFSDVNVGTTRTNLTVISEFAGAAEYIWDGKILSEFAGPHIATFDGTNISEFAGAHKYKWHNNILSAYAGANMYSVSNGTISRFAGEAIYRFNNREVSRFAGAKVLSIKGDVPVPEPIIIIIAERLMRK